MNSGIKQLRKIHWKDSDRVELSTLNFQVDKEHSAAFLWDKTIGFFLVFIMSDSIWVFVFLLNWVLHLSHGSLTYLFSGDKMLFKLVELHFEWKHRVLLVWWWSLLGTSRLTYFFHYSVYHFLTSPPNCLPVRCTFSCDSADTLAYMLQLFCLLVFLQCH